MSWIAVAIGGVSLVGNLISSSNSASAASDASNAQIMQSQQAIEEQRRQFDLSRADTAPYRETGVMANARLRQLLGLDSGYGGTDSGSLTRRFGEADLAADPVYNSGLQFGLNEGIKGVNARALGSGMYDSGATLKALTRYANDYGSTKANESYNRFNTDAGNIYNRLAGISGTGQTAVGQVTSAGQNATSSIADLLTGQGNARAAGIVGGANAWGSAAGGLNSALNNYQSSRTLQQLLGGRSSSYPYVNEQATGQYSLSDPAYG